MPSLFRKQFWPVVLGCLIAVGFVGCSGNPFGGSVGTNATPVVSYVFQDSLKNNNNNWNTDENCAFKSDGYHITTSYICYSPADAIADGVATVTVSQVSGDDKTFFGLVFRRPSKGNYYQFEIDANGKWRFAKVVDGTSTDLVPYQANDAIKPGLNVPNKLSVKFVGPNYIFSVNDKQVGQFSDSTFTAAGLVGLDGADGLDIVYTKFSIAKP